VNDAGEFARLQVLQSVAKFGAQSGGIHFTDESAVRRGGIDGFFFGDGGEIFAGLEASEDLIGVFGRGEDDDLDGNFMRLSRERRVQSGESEQKRETENAGGLQKQFGINLDR
jgi:hypothetical protein